MKIFRWVLLVANVIAMLLTVLGMANTPDVIGVLIGVVFGVILLANIIFLVMTGRRERRDVGRITGVFE
jgi:hypothetical protein